MPGLVYRSTFPQVCPSCSSCGANCAKWLLEIGKKKDVTVNLNYLMRFPDSDILEVFIKNENRLITSSEDYVLTAVKYV